MDTKPLFKFVMERWRILQRRQAGQAAPWTKDPVLQRYRFCNVYREDDKVTRWIADNWRTPHAEDHDLWFAIVIARLVNWPDTLQEMGYPTPWEGFRERFLKTLHGRMADGQKTWSAAYLVNQKMKGGAGMDKASYLAKNVLDPLWQHRDLLSPNRVKYANPHFHSLAHYYELLTQFNGLGSFMAGQIIADLKYVPDTFLAFAPDWWTWCAPGPGSKRGLNRVCGRPLTKGWSHEVFTNTMVEVIIDAQHWTDRNGMPRMHAQDLQNCLCEYDKYQRAKLGEGTPRSVYKGN